MSTDVISLVAKKRDVLGKKVNALRAQGETPAVVHDHGKPSIHIVVPEVELKRAYAEAGKHHSVELNVDGKKYTAMIKEIVNKPATNRLYHGVFQAVSANEKVVAEVPLHLSGDIPAVRASLLVLKQLETVEVEALPKDLIDSIEVDASGLENVGDKITVAELKVPSTVVIKTDPEHVIATVEMPKDQIAEADAAAADLAEDAGKPEEPTAEAEAAESTEEQTAENA